MWRDSMFWMMKALGLGIWVAILSMAIVATLFKNGTEKDATFVYVAIMDFIVITGVTKTILKIVRGSN
jgi:hypothetical protein